MSEQTRRDRGLVSDADTGTATQNELAEVLSRLARAFEDEKGTQATLTAVVAAAIELVPGAQEASISVATGRGQISSTAASSALPVAVDALQERTGQGPCLDAMWNQRSVRVANMSTEQRWPQFAARAAAETGVASMLSVQLFVEHNNLGALNIFSRLRTAFSDESEQVALLIAAHAAIAFAGALKGENLESALASRDLIGQAKGILMERFKVTADAAFLLLAQASQHSNRKLRDIAAELATTGALDLTDRTD